MTIQIYKPGLLDYAAAVNLQYNLASMRIDGEIEDTLLILEHPPTITIGSSGSPENILVSQQVLTEYGIKVFFTDRGGDVTYHGPGQIVCYPVMDLSNRSRDLHGYVYNLEQIIIRTLQDFDIMVHRGHNHRGVWADNRQIASIGIRVKRWVTMHGFALNVAPDMKPFSFINPCGFAGGAVTSLEEQVQRSVSKEQVIELIVSRFSDIFHTNVVLKDSIPDWSRINGSKTPSVV